MDLLSSLRKHMAEDAEANDAEGNPVFMVGVVANDPSLPSHSSMNTVFKQVKITKATNEAQARELAVAFYKARGYRNCKATSVDKV